MPRKRRQDKQIKSKKNSEIPKTNINISFKLFISNEFKFSCSVINSDNNTEKTIKLKESDTKEYPFTFTLENNKIDFIEDLIQNPNEYKLYTIQYQQKEYNVIAEVFIALIICDFVKKAKKEFIIPKTIVELPF